MRDSGSKNWWSTSGVRWKCVCWREESLEVRWYHHLPKYSLRRNTALKKHYLTKIYGRYSTFVNWELWWPNFPILVYFKETQTKPEGQIHFFPVIFVGIFNLPSLLLNILDSLIIIITSLCCRMENSYMMSCWSELDHQKPACQNSTSWRAQYNCHSVISITQFCLSCWNLKYSLAF